MKSTHIFTEIVNCGKIGKIALDSFHKYHNLKVNVYGTSKDFESISYHPNNNLIEVTSDVIEQFKFGHAGTAHLWAKTIQTVTEDNLLHFDSDVIFRANIIDEFLDKLEVYDLVGPIRNYKHNPNNRDDVRSLNDVCQTLCFGFNKSKINNHSFAELKSMCKGDHNPLGHGIIDFFDPVMFEILHNDGKIYHFHVDDVGGCDYYGTRNNKHKEINNIETPFKIDFGDRLIHFSAVGSGMNIFTNKNVNIPEGYKNYALDRYALFCKIFYNENIGIDVSKYKKILEIKNWF